MTSTRHILVIDDEKRMADSVCQLLKREGWEAVAAYTGRDGLRHLGEKVYDLVVTDLRMSEIDGLDVLKHIRLHHPDTLVILMTGHASTESAIEALHHDAFDYLPKPFEFEHLMMSVTRAFNRIDTERMRADMISMISHDIKVPLTSIIGYTTLIHNRRTGDYHSKAADFLDIISSNAHKILALLDNYLTTCKFEAGRLLIQRTQVRMRDLISDLDEILTPEATKRGMTFQIECPDNLPPMQVDESLILRALCNIGSNALKYAPPNTEVKVTAAHLPAEISPLEQETIACSIENTGAGIPAQDLPHVFDRYRRTGTSRGIEGSGLGLFVVKTVLEAHGGTASVESTPDVFTRFTIHIPLISEAIQA